jgi:hypothetical protein
VNLTDVNGSFNFSIKVGSLILPMNSSPIFISDTINLQVTANEM